MRGALRRNVFVLKLPTEERGLGKGQGGVAEEALLQHHPSLPKPAARYREFLMPEHVWGKT